MPETQAVATAALSAPQLSGRQHLRVLRKTQLADGTMGFTLQAPDGHALPGWTAGAHISVHTPCGAARHYSLCGDPQETSVYEIAVKRDAAGRGGSVSMADVLQEGELIEVGPPVNHFALHPRASQFIFVAGGIGITPILAMMRHLASTCQGRFKLFYLTRDRASTAFGDEIQALAHAGQITLHHDGGQPDLALDLWPVFEKPTNAQVYCCGPRGLMDSVRDMTGHWPSGSIHFESFGVDAQTRAQNQPFTVRLQKSGVTLQVGAQQTILQALHASGHPVASSCESGSCGTCRTGLLQGQAEHRDFVLSEGEHEHHIMVCVSRARSAQLVLDL